VIIIKIMKKFLPQLGGKSEGSALLVTILLMGVLMMLTLGISTLVIQEIRVTRTVVDSGRAFYSAEAGVENALLALRSNGVGFQPEKQVESLASDDLLDPDFKFNYHIQNTTDKLPAFSPDKPIFVALSKLSSADNVDSMAYSQSLLYANEPAVTFQRLGLNQTVLIPLFTGDGATVDNKITEFVVQYYVNFRKENLIGAFQGVATSEALPFTLNDFNILRWKMYGKDQDKTESIADFFPATETSGPNSPVCLGSNLNLRAGSETCTTPAFSLPNQNGELIDNPAITLASAARECYQSDAGSQVTGFGALIKKATSENADGCNMNIFLQTHTQNYLVLTNMVNPDLLGIGNTGDADQIAIADIYYRVIVKGDEESPKLPRDYAVVEANGFSAKGTVRKSIDTYYKASSVLPVFQFSLYNTDTEE